MSDDQTRFWKGACPICGVKEWAIIFAGCVTCANGHPSELLPRPATQQRVVAEATPEESHG